MKMALIAGLAIGMALSPVNAHGAGRIPAKERELKKLRDDGAGTNFQAVMKQMRSEIAASNMDTFFQNKAVNVGKYISLSSLESFRIRGWQVKPECSEVTGEYILSQLYNDEKEAEKNMATEDAIKERKQVLVESLEFISLVETMTSSTHLIAEEQAHVDAVVVQWYLTTQLSSMTKEDRDGHLEIMKAAVDLRPAAETAWAARADVLFFKALQQKTGSREKALIAEKNLIDKYSLSPSCSRSIESKR